MNNSEIMQHIDHTRLVATATWDEIKSLCDEAISGSTASVCIPPSYVKRAKEYLRDKMAVCTVIGFPLGYSTTKAKLAETVEALSDGADEIDMVVNLGDVKNKDFDKVTEEIAQIKQAVGSKVLKVIVETCYLTEEEKIQLCKCVTAGGADYIKTSTGFGTAGAKLEDIELFKKYIGNNVKIKAAGGVKTKEDLEKFIAAGCHRIGASSAVKMLKQME